jgi:amylosucrase
MKQIAAIERRKRLHLDDFLRSYRILYPQAGPEHVQRLMDLLEQYAQARPQSLKDLDEQRERQADWFQSPQHVGIMLYVDLFAGNLNGVIKKIPYFKELGVTYVHLMPLLRPRTGPSDGGYAVANYREINPKLGDMAQLSELTKHLHEEGMMLVIDYVMNHTAKEHAWAQAALAGDEKFQDYYIMFPDRKMPDAYERSLPEVFPDFAPGNFTWQPEIKKWVWTTFYDFQWDLNYRNPAVFEAMLGEMLFLVNAGVDVLRLDAVPFLWKNLGTNCQNQAEAVHILAAYRALVRMVAPGVLFKSEAIVAPEDIIKYLGSGGFEGKVCEIGYNATLMNHLWHALAAENTHLLRSTLSKLPPIPTEATWINYIRCHDDIGWGISDENATAVGQQGRATRNFCTDFYAGLLPQSYAEGYIFQRDRNTGEARNSGTAAAFAGLQRAMVEADPRQIAQAVQRLAVMNGVIFFMRGIPLIFSGDEIGQFNDFSYLQDPEKAGDNRWVHRPPMDWNKAKLRKQQGSVEHQIFDLHRNYAKVRSQSRALHGRSVDRIILPLSPALFLCERRFQDEVMLLIANLSRNPQTLNLNELPLDWRTGIYHDALKGHDLNFPDGQIFVAGYGIHWLKPKTKFEPEGNNKINLRMEVHAEYGETLRVVGSIPALGNWDPAKGIPCNPQNYPIWSCELDIPTGQAFSWKWVRMRGEQVVAWADQNLGWMP